METTEAKIREELWGKELHPSSISVSFEQGKVLRRMVLLVRITIVKCREGLRVIGDIEVFGGRGKWAYVSFSKPFAAAIATASARFLTLSFSRIFLR